MTMKFLPEDHSCYAIDLVDLDGQDKLKLAIEHDLNENNEEYVLRAALQEVFKDLKKQEELALLPSHQGPSPLRFIKWLLSATIFYHGKTTNIPKFDSKCLWAMTP